MFSFQGFWNFHILFRRGFLTHCGWRIFSDDVIPSESSLALGPKRGLTWGRRCGSGERVRAAVPPAGGLRVPVVSCLLFRVVRPGGRALQRPAGASVSPWGPQPSMPDLGLGCIVWSCWSWCVWTARRPGGHLDVGSVCVTVAATVASFHDRETGVHAHSDQPVLLLTLGSVRPCFWSSSFQSPWLSTGYLGHWTWRWVCSVARPLRPTYSLFSFPHFCLPLVDLSDFW